MISRRTALAGLASSLAVATNPAATNTTSKRKFTVDLRASSIGVQANQSEVISLAAKHNFESVGASAYEIGSMSDAAIAKLVEQLESEKLTWGSAGLPVEFRKDDAKFKSDLDALPKRAAALRKVGVSRMGTWIMPGSDELTYLENFKLHSSRLKTIASILDANGLRFGLEYVGTPSLRFQKRFSFLHSMREAGELLESINAPNMGFILDSWHWYTAGESADDIRKLNNQNVVACDLNDAPAGLEIAEQKDNKRELPLATGVIDLQSFLRVLVEIDYDGPVRAEPFNQTLNQLNNDQACAATSKSIRASFDLI
ncbi:MAG: sugar phosphate isomerase/epimerase family protein [Planctomycetota bacterium]